MIILNLAKSGLICKYRWCNLPQKMGLSFVKTAPYNLIYNLTML